MPEPYWTVLDRDAALVEGPDAVTYLQGQLSQDVAALDDGASAWSWVLAPQGKVDALVRVTRRRADSLLVDTDPGWGDALVARLNRFKLRTKVDITPTPCRVLAVRGGDGTALPGLRLAALWRGEPAVDVLLDDGAEAAGPGRRVDGDAWEAARILAGVPVMGAELTEKTIPAETGLVPHTVSFTKGCYTGQELVARIDSRGGHVARHLRLLRSASPLTPGDELMAGERTVGTVTSAASITSAAASGAPDLASAPAVAPGDSGRDVGASTVALGWVGRAVEPGQRVRSGHAEVEVVALPAP